MPLCVTDPVLSHNIGCWWTEKRKFSMHLNTLPLRHRDLLKACNLGKQGSRQLNETHSSRGILVCFGCHNKILQTGQLNNRNLFPSSSGGWKDQGLTGFSFWGEPSSWLADGYLLAESSHGLSSGLKLSSMSLSPFMKATTSTSRALPSWPDLILITSQRPYFQISSHWVLELQYINWGWGCPQIFGPSQEATHAITGWSQNMGSFQKHGFKTQFQVPNDMALCFKGQGTSS